MNNHPAPFPSSAPPDLPPSVSGRWVSLRAVSHADYPTFFAWRADLQELQFWSVPNRVPSWEEFRVEMERLISQSITFLVSARDSGRPIGFVQAYNLNPNEGWAFTATYTAREYRGRPHAVEGYIALTDYLFRSFPLRKVYADVYDFNIAPLKPLMAGGFVEEGRFRDHTWHDDRYWDVIRLALYRDRWLEVRERTHFLLGVAEETAELMEEREREAAAADADGHRP